MTTSPLTRLTPTQDSPYLELRPLRLGEILDRTIHLYRAHFLLFFGISVFPVSVYRFVKLLEALVERHLAADGAWFNAALHTKTILGLVALLAEVMAFSVSLAATNRAILDLFLGQRPSVVGSYQKTRPHWMRLVRLNLIGDFYSWGTYAILECLIDFGPAAISGVFRGRPNSALSLFAAWTAYLFTYFIGVRLSLRYALCVPASISEGLSIRAALKRSVTLTTKSRGRIFAMVLLYAATGVGLSMLVHLPFRMLGLRPWLYTKAVPVVALIAYQLSMFAYHSLVVPIYSIAITLFYYDERIRKEGFDIEWMMQRADLAVPDAPTAPCGPPPPSEPPIMQQNRSAV